MTGRALPEVVPGWAAEDAARHGELERLGPRCTLPEMQEYLHLGAQRRAAHAVWERAELARLTDTPAGNSRPGR